MKSMKMTIQEILSFEIFLSILNAWTYDSENNFSFLYYSRPLVH